MKNILARCTHPVPPNEFGIFAMHCRDNEPIEAEAIRNIIDGPIAASEPKLKEALQNPVDE